MSEELEKNDRGDLFSKSVRAGKRTYFFDVKSTRGNDYYLTITESKKRFGTDGKFTYEKHKIFLYKEDFEKFIEGLNEAITHIKENAPEPDTTSQVSGEKKESDISFEDLGN
ncbi:MAG: PUR family DNA/RNA-binding protein [Bacteroidia bacterium]|nr:PUR family DNA/RNA-binding protein [Bacteroidia bacterium]